MLLVGGMAVIGRAPAAASSACAALRVPFKPASHSLLCRNRSWSPAHKELHSFVLACPGSLTNNALGRAPRSACPHPCGESHKSGAPPPITQRGKVRPHTEAPSSC